MNTQTATLSELPRVEAPVVRRDLSIGAVSVRYPNGTVALDDVSLNCPGGQITVLLGPSGCGKTTLLRSVAGLVDVTEGSIHLGDWALTRLEPRERQVAMVFQDYALYPNKTTRQNIEFPMKMTGVGRPERRRRAEEVARLLQLQELLERKPVQMSGGQQQRVGIARAIAREPQLLLADEPLSNLDADLRITMRRELRLLQRSLGTTMVYVTHDQAEALSLADELVVMRAGKIEQNGPPSDVFDRPATTFAAAFLGRMNLVRGTVDKHGFTTPGGHVTVPGRFVPPSLRDSEATVGVRPQHLTLGTNLDAALQLKGVVTQRELLGSDEMLTVETGDDEVQVSRPSRQPTADAVSARASAEDIHWFDTSGRRAEAPQAASGVG